MKIRKRVKAEIPTVQYGNVEVETSLEWDTEVDGKPSNDALLRIQNTGTLLDKMIRQEYTKFHSEMEKEIERITSFGAKKNEKELSRKEQIKQTSKR